MRTILIVGGYAGFYTAWKLRKMLCRGEARVEAAVAIRDRLLTAFDQAAGLPRGPDAGGAGDDAAVPGLAAARSGVSTVPNTRLLTRNLIATLRGRKPLISVQHPRAAFLAGARPAADALRS